jgi:hypothetical protein
VAAIVSSLGKNTENLPFTEVFFYAKNTVPKVFKQFFENGETELWLSLLIPKLRFFMCGL